jgi:hypothetical protein
MMTEAEWLVTLDPLELLSNLSGKPSWRKMRLAAVACCRLMHDFLPDVRSIRAVDFAELYADKQHGSADPGEMEELAIRVVDESSELGRNPHNDAAHCAAMCLAFWAPAYWGTYQVFRWSGPYVPREKQVGIVACVFGVPRRQSRLLIKVNPAWRTSDVMMLAHGIYADRAFDRLPILADSLQDAGCDNDDLLSHLRDMTVQHVRGCWALDLVLGKE